MFDAFLLRSTLLVLIGYTAVWTLLTVFRVKSPRLHRTAWFAVLLLGCCGAGFNVEIPLPVSATLRHPRAGGDLEGKRAIPLHNAQFKRIAQILITPQEAVQTVLIPSSLGPRLRGDDGHDFKLAQMIGVVWLLGIAFVFLRWTYRYAAFRKILKSSSPAPDDWLAEWHAVGGQRIPMLVADVAGPALVRNFFGYVLVVPPEYWLNIKPVLRASVLRHEFAHYRRRDALKSLLVRLLALPQWFNPCAWSAVKRFDDAAEWACDEAACGGSDDAVAEFAEALVALHESLQRLPRRSRLFSGFASRVPSARIRRLVLVHHHQTLKDSLMKKTTVLTVCVLLLLGGFFQFRLVAQSDQKSADQSRARQEAVPRRPLPDGRGSDVIPKKEESKTPWSPKNNTTERNSDTYWRQQQPKPGPDVGKFRIPIEYTLKNIPAASLKEFLTEQFKDSTVEVAEPTMPGAMGGATSSSIIITASLEDHKAIKKMLVEIEREVETLRNDAAETGSEIKVFTLKNASAETLLPHISDRCKASIDPRNNTLVVAGPPSAIAAVEKLVQKLDEKPAVTKSGSFGAPHFGSLSPTSAVIPTVEPKPEAKKEKE